MIVAAAVIAPNVRHMLFCFDPAAAVRAAVVLPAFAGELRHARCTCNPVLDLHRLAVPISHAELAAVPVHLWWRGRLGPPLHHGALLAGCGGGEGWVPEAPYGGGRPQQRLQHAEWRGRSDALCAACITLERHYSSCLTACSVLPGCRHAELSRLGCCMLALCCSGGGAAGHSTRGRARCLSGAALSGGRSESVWICDEYSVRLARQRLLPAPAVPLPCW